MSQLQVTGEAKVRDIQGPVVANSGVITALDGDASQYVRGDGTLADFPTSTGGGSSVSYYLNSSVSQGTIGGVAYRQLSKTPISGAGTDITASTNGYIASYLTDANDPALLEVPAGNFNCEFYFSVNSNAHNPYVYAELYKYDGTTFTLLGSSQSIPEYLTNGTTLSAYYFAIPVAVAALTITDRLAIRIYANVDTRVVTLHTENNHLCQVVTTFSKGLTSLNNLTRQVQFLATGTSGTDFNISSSTATHTFNIPDASATNRGLITTGTQTIAGNKTFTGENYFSLVNMFDQSINYKTDAVLVGVSGYISQAYAKSGSGASSILSMKIADGSSVKNISLDFIGSAVTTPYSYLFPAFSGTMALLEGTQIFSGAKTFSDNPIINGAGTNSAYTILQSAGTNKWRIGNNYAAGVNTFDIFAYDNSSTPLSINSNGAMTLSANVTTTGAQFVQNGFYLSNANAGARAFYTLMWGSDNGINFALRNGTGGASFIFQSATGYNYTFPAATGTLALTSNLSAYLPLAGGTLTGALGGTSASFSSTLTAGDTTIINVAPILAIQSNTTGNIFLRFRQSADTMASMFYTNATATFTMSNNMGGLRFNTSGVIDAMNIIANGNVGISTNTPLGSSAERTLHLSDGGGGYATIYVTNSSNSVKSIFGMQSSQNLGIVGTQTNTPFAIVTNDTERMRIDSSGGILFRGSTTASNGVYLSNDSSLFKMYAGDSSVSTKGFAFYVTNGSTQPEAMRITSEGELYWNLTGVSGGSLNGGGVLFRNNTGKYVQISTGVTFDNGLIYFYKSDGAGSVTNTGSIATSGNSTVYNTTSDYRLKQDFQDYNGLRLISKIKTYDYEWKSDKTRMFGVIAHELAEVLPYAVTGKKDAEEMQSVDYSKLVPILVKSIQELEARIKQLENK
jgi:hypothetical protein